MTEIKKEWIEGLLNLSRKLGGELKGREFMIPDSLRGPIYQLIGYCESADSFIEKDD